MRGRLLPVLPALKTVGDKLSLARVARCDEQAALVRFSDQRRDRLDIALVSTDRCRPSLVVDKRRFQMVEPDLAVVLREKNLHPSLSQYGVRDALQQGFFRRQNGAAKVVGVDDDAALVTEDSETVRRQLEVAERAGPVGDDIVLRRTDARVGGSSRAAADVLLLQKNSFQKVVRHTVSPPVVGRQSILNEADA